MKKTMILFVSLCLLSSTLIGQTVKRTIGEKNRYLMFKNKVEQRLNTEGEDQMTKYFFTKEPKALNNHATSLKSSQINKQSLDSIIYEEYNETTSQWIADGKLEYTYDANGNNTQMIYYYWDETSSQWLAVEKYEFTYDAYSNMTEYMSHEWDETTSQLVGDEKWVCTYDASGNMTQELDYYWDENTSQWVPFWKGIFTYNANGSMTQVIDYRWDEYTSLLVLSSKEEYTYDANGNMTQEIYYRWDKSTSQWVYDEKRAYTYDANGNETQGIFSHWNETTSQWVVSQKYEDAYDANGNCTHIWYDWDEITSQWVGDDKYIFTYDASGNMTLVIDYNWDESTSQWVGDEKGEYTYDLAYGLSDIIMPDDEYMEDFESINNMPIDYIYYYFTNNTWIESYKGTYYYSDYSASADTACKSDFTWIADTDPTLIHFSDASAPGVVSWYWNFGDGLSGSTRNPEHTYNNPGYYLVSLSTRNTTGDCIDHHAELIQVGAAECKAGFDYSVDAQNLSVTFHDLSTGKIKTHFWMFGDGLISAEKNPVHEYAGPGIYEVSLTVMDSSGTCMDYLSEQVQVGTVDCNADFSVFVDSLTNTAYFSNQSTGSSNTCYWLFGDGTKSTDTDPVHQFIAPGLYNVSLNVFNDQTGCMDLHEEVILIGSMGTGCKADFIYQADQSSNTVSFADRSLGADLTYFWYFGDGSFSTDQHPEHPYPDGGIYNVCLTVYSTGGIQNTSCKYIFAGTPAAGSCLAQFAYNVNDAARTVNYTNKSFGEPDTWTWRFGDNNTSGQQNPEHIFTEAGYYITQLTISKQGSGCLSHAVEIVNVDMAGALKAGYGYFVDILNTKAESYPVDYIGVSLGDASKYKWSFGDGTYDSTTTTPTHEYTAPGTYEVCLIVYNLVTGAEDSYCEYVVVGPTSTQPFNHETISMLCYPNPADNNCMIILDLPVSGFTELSLYSIMGSKLRTIVRETLDRGRHSYELKSGDLENGLYIIQLQNSSGTITQMLNIQH